MPEPDYKIIICKNGEEVLVDVDDYEWLSQFKWRISWSGSRGYVVRWGAGRNVYMHRMLFPDAETVDHKDGNVRDNRKANLRPATKIEQGANRLKQRKASSQYKGVSWHSRLHKWRAEIRVNYKSIHLGYFDNEEDAARAYDEAARKYFGEHAALNFPEPGERSALNA